MPAGMLKNDVPFLKEWLNYTLSRRGTQGVDEKEKTDKKLIIQVSRQDGGSPYGRNKRDGDGSGLCSKGVYGADTIYELHANSPSGYASARLNLYGSPVRRELVLRTSSSNFDITSLASRCLFNSAAR